RYKQALGRSERLYGSLDGEQQGVLRRQVALAPFDPSGTLEQRRQRQQAIRQMLLSLSVHRGTMEEARLISRTTLDGLLDSSMLSETSGRDAALQQTCRSIAATHNSTTVAQRGAAVRRLQGWQADLRALAAASR
ncbi:MAG: hypothetical protein ABIT82_02775, partial [Ramlibacter sp.]